MTNNYTVQPCHVYGLPQRDTMRTMTIAEVFQFGFRHASQGMVAVYMGPHVQTFEAGCLMGQEVKNAREALAASQQRVEDLTAQRDGLVSAIKAVRASRDRMEQELNEAQTALAGVRPLRTFFPSLFPFRSL